MGITLGRLVAGKTKLDLLITPAITILCGGAAGILVGPPISSFMGWLGELVNWGTMQQPILMGIVVSVVMGMVLTLPISSAALGIILGLSGPAAGAATIGCCCQMVGFAVASYKENGIGGLLAQGLGTSMLQVPNTCQTSAYMDTADSFVGNFRSYSHQRHFSYDEQCDRLRHGLGRARGADYDVSDDDCFGIGGSSDD